MKKFVVPTGDWLSERQSADYKKLVNQLNTRMSPFAQIKRPVQHLLEQYAVQAKVLNSMNIPFANSIAASALSSAIPVDAVVEYSRRQSEQYAKLHNIFAIDI